MIDDDNKTGIALVLMIGIIFLLVVGELWWYYRYRFATELYYQSNYPSNVVKYEQCRYKDLIEILQEKIGE